METITIAELKKKLEDFEMITLLDIRPAADYQKIHIKGAISLPLNNQMRQEAKVFLKKEDDIILYGAGLDVEEAFSQLKKNGYPKLHAFPGGIQEWQASGGAVTDKVSMG